MKKISVVILFLNSFVFIFLTIGKIEAQSRLDGQESKIVQEPSIKTESLDLFDKTRNRSVPVTLYSPAVESAKPKTKLKLAVLNHGYGMKNTEYSFIAETLVAQGYFVASIQHELPTDEPMPTSGKPSVVRRPFWERNVQNILFVIEELKKIRPALDFRNLLVAGHSNGGDAAMLFAEKYPKLAVKIISLDNRRMTIPRLKNPKILSIRSSDQTADEGVLPNDQEQKRFDIEIVELKNTKHDEMWDGASLPQKLEINEIISKFLTNKIKSQTTRKRKSGLEKEIRKIAESAQGRVGAAAVILETGESISLNSNEHFPMQSVFKLPLAMAILRQIDAGKIKLADRIKIEPDDLVGKHLRSPLRDEFPNGTEMSVSELLRLAVSESDGTAADVLIKLLGGALEVNKFLREIKVREMNVVNNEKEIGADWETQYRNWTSPEGAVRLLRVLHESKILSPKSTALLLENMIDTPTGKNRLKALLPAGTSVAHKTGTSGKQRGITAATNDIGIIKLPNGKHLAIAVFIADSPADEATREKLIAEIARAAWDCWSGR